MCPSRNCVKVKLRSYKSDNYKSVPQPSLFKAYTDAMSTAEFAAEASGLQDLDKMRRWTVLGIESLKATGFEDVREKLENALTNMRFTLPLSKRRFGYPTCTHKCVSFKHDSCCLLVHDSRQKDSIEKVDSCGLVRCVVHWMAFLFSADY